MDTFTHDPVSMSAEPSPESSATASVNDGTIKLPNFLPLNIRLWFRMVEFIFNRDGIRNEHTMYSIIKSNLSTDPNWPNDNIQWTRIENETNQPPYSLFKSTLLIRQSKKTKLWSNKIKKLMSKNKVMDSTNKSDIEDKTVDQNDHMVGEQLVEKFENVLIVSEEPSTHQLI